MTGGPILPESITLSSKESLAAVTTVYIIVDFVAPLYFEYEYNLPGKMIVATDNEKKREWTWNRAEYIQMTVRMWSTGKLIPRLSAEVYSKTPTEPTEM